MLFLFNKKIEEREYLRRGLSRIYGLNTFSINSCLKFLGFNSRAQVQFGDLDKNQLEELSNFIASNFVIEISLKKLIRNQKKILKESESYRGLRLKKSLPVRGQRTHTNAKTSKKFKH